MQTAFLRPPPASAPHWRRPTPCQRLPLAAAPPTRPARRGSPVDAPRSQAERGAAPSGQAAQDGREAGQQGGPGAPASEKTAAAGGYGGERFTVLIWGSDRDKFGQPEVAYQGKRVCATGTIKLFRSKRSAVDKPQMVVSQPRQLRTE